MSDDSSSPKVGATLRGRVVRFLPQGAMLQIGPGVVGLLRGSEISWFDKLTKASEVFTIGDELDVVVLEVKRATKSQKPLVSLGHRQTQPNPWDTVEKKHPVGCKVNGKVIDFLPFGAQVEFASGFQALVHDSEVSWTEPKAKAQDVLRRGDEIEVVVQLVDKEKRRIHASYRQAIENPWLTFLDQFPIGAVTTGRVVSVRDYGVFVRLPNGCVGLLHRNHFPPDVSAIPLGESVRVVVLGYDAVKQRIPLGHGSV